VYRLTVQLQPRASHTRIVGWHGDAIKIQVQAAAVDGAANAALIEILANTFHVTRRSVRLVQGRTARRKTVEIDAEAPECARRLAELLGEGTR